MNGILSYPETRGYDFGVGDVLWGLFCEFFIEFVLEGLLELLFAM